MPGGPARTSTALVAAAVISVGGLGVVASPASAQGTGLTFCSGTFTTVVAHFPVPTDGCAALPPTADSHVGWSGFRDVVFYPTADCTGQATAVGTLRTYEAGRWQSFLAS